MSLPSSSRFLNPQPALQAENPATATYKTRGRKLRLWTAYVFESLPLSCYIYTYIYISFLRLIGLQVSKGLRWGFPKIGVIILRVPIIRFIIVWGLFGGTPI